jgi:RNA polymerase-binding transcription factor DksA
MATDTNSLGICPECGAEIQAFQLLIEYEQENGTRGRFAECLSCDAVIRPT